MAMKFLTLTAAALMLSTAPAFAQDCASKCAGKETKSVAASACTGKAESASVAGMAGNDEAKGACPAMKAESVAAKADCASKCSGTEAVAAGMAGNDEAKAACSAAASACSTKTESVAAKADCASKCSGTEAVAAGMAGNDEAKAACSAVKTESVAAKADCASKCSGTEAVAAGMAGNDEAKAACTDAEKAACASACSATKTVAAGMAGNDGAKAACASACSTKTEAVAAGMAGNDEHKCTGACGGSTETVAAGMAGNDAMANGKDKAYRVGSKVNDFTATHAQTGASASLSGVAGDKATVLIFWNQNCPYVVEMVERVDAFATEYASKGVSVVAVDAGVNNTKDSIMAHAKDRSFPVMINEDSKVAAQFAASRTPEVFILDGNMNVVYHGAFDSGKENTPGSREHHVKTAVDEILGGKAVSTTQTRAFGCSLKYAKDAKPLPTS